MHDGVLVELARPLGAHAVHHVVPLHLALAVLDGAGGGDLAAEDEVAHLVEGAAELGPAGPELGVGRFCTSLDILLVLFLIK